MTARSLSLCRLAFALLLLGGAAPPARAGDAPCYLAKALADGSYRAETFALGMPKELADVQARFAEAVAREQDWLQAYLARLDLKPGEPLPYHEKLGVSRAEYAALLRAYERPAIVPLRPLQLEVRCAGGITRLRAAGHEELGQLEIAANGTLRAPSGLECRPERVTARQAKFGAWSGTTWAFESADVARRDVRHFELSIGRLDGSGRVVLYFDHQVIEGGRRLASDRLLAWLVAK